MRFIFSLLALIAVCEIGLVPILAHFLFLAGLWFICFMIGCVLIVAGIFIYQGEFTSGSYSKW